jgi:hypothetical protein
MVFAKEGKLSRPTHRRFWSVALVAALIVSWVGVAVAQDLPKADDVIDKYVKAVGKYVKDGKPAELKSRVTKGTFTLVEMGMDADMETYLVPPNSYTKIEFEGFGSLERGVKGDVAWQINPMEGPSILEGQQKVAALRDAAGFIEFENWKENFAKAETTGEGTVGDAACYKVLMTPKEGPSITCFFDKESGLLLKTELEVQGLTIVSTLSDYKETDGIKMAHKVATDGGQFGMEITIESVEYNVDVPADRFDLPDEIKELQN